jgi:putative peptide zinc metalloprotease protein
MSNPRPTFDDAWYQVAQLKPRLRTGIRTYRQTYRAQIWYVLADPTYQKFERINEFGYRFVNLMNGHRTIAQAWEIANKKFDDDAPTQGEIIRILGGLYTSNLLQVDLSSSASQLFERQQKRARKEVGSYMMNIMFARIRVFNPQWILTQFVGAVGWVFGPVGILLWFGLLATAGYFLVGRFDDLALGADPQILLRTENWVWLYICFTTVKIIHEFGHAFACAHFGRRNGIPAPVHTMGMMLLVFVPVPYVDTSSVWAFRNKWHRVFVGAAGMYVELAIASVAALVWAHTNPGTLPNVMAYNVMFISSISTLLFNANPLLRFDGYFMLSDLLEIPNYSQRSTQFVHYLVRRFVFGIPNAISPAYSAWEQGWMAAYGPIAAVYRVVICVGILWYIASFSIFVASIFLVASVITWVFTPIMKYLKYLLTSPELTRRRLRAVVITVCTLALLLGSVGAVPFPDRGTAEGIIEPVKVATIYMGADGIIEQVLQSGQPIDQTGQILVTASSEALATQQRELDGRHRAMTIRRNIARTKDPAVVQSLTDQLASLEKLQSRIAQDIEALTIKAPFQGLWVCQESDQLQGTYIQRGQRVGLVVAPEDLLIRVTADQELGPRIASNAVKLGSDGKSKYAAVEFRVAGQPQKIFTGTIERVLPAGLEQLPSAALGYAGGGEIRVTGNDPQGTKTASPFFEVHVRPDFGNPSDTSADSATDLRPLIGQRVIVRFTSPPKPLALQWWRAIKQLVQRRSTTSASSQP